MALELLLSVIFDLTMIGSVKKGHTLNCLLIVVITLNILTAGRLFLKLRGIKCASSIMAYVIWKIVQEVVMVPALVVFSFICVDKYLRSWENVNQGVRILVIVWTYAIYSLFLIIFLGWLARFLWVLQTNSRNSDKNGENATTISFIDGFHDDQELLDATVPRDTVEMMEMRDLRTSSRPFVPYDNVVPYISN
ncbi:hypothetical protein CAEBREN_09081 [Caenorhabditis brenneri]|uniref:Uncharacterized protein n=1 Tax=Caenorhabditis brenneri TaxID=135651 RepID=G0P0E8_CAEBE|nr:hypothetical protein CAEBREN_09081 [Caenorhabditis brenneri]